MRLLATAALASAGLVLAGCTGDNAPAPPPTPDPAPTTQPATTSPDDTDITTATSSPTSDAVETTEASGPPEMPDEATENTEAGAEAFALHYIDLINYTGIQPQPGLLEEHSSEECGACLNHEQSVVDALGSGEMLNRDIWRVEDVVTLHQPGLSTASSRIEITQMQQDVLDASGEPVDRVEEAHGVLVFDLSYDSRWQIQEIAFQSSP